MQLKCRCSLIYQSRFEMYSANQDALNSTHCFYGVENFPSTLHEFLTERCTMQVYYCDRSKYVAPSYVRHHITLFAFYFSTGIARISAKGFFIIQYGISRIGR